MSTLPLTLELNKCLNYATSLVGEEARTLAQLEQQKFPVRRTIVVPANTFLIAYQHLWQQWEYFLSQARVHEPTTILQAAELIQKSILHNPVPNEIRNVITQAYQHLNTPTVILKTSRCSTQLPRNALESPPFSGEDNLFIKLKEQWSFFFSHQLLHKYLQKNLPISACAHAILIQVHAEPIISGHLYTHHFSSGKHKRLGLVQAIWGECSLNDPLDHLADNVEIDRLTKKTVFHQIAPQYYQKKYQHSELQKIALPKDRQYSAKLTKLHIEVFSDWLTALQKLFFFPQKILFAVTNDSAIEILGCIPMDIEQNNPEPVPPPTIAICHATGIHPGKVSGPLWKEPLKKPIQPSIFLLHSVDQLKKIDLSMALGILFDRAVNSQEVLLYSLPAVASVMGRVSHLSNGILVEINGSSGQISLPPPVPVRGGGENHTQLRNRVTPQTPHTLQLYLSTGELNKIPQQTLDQSAGIGMLRVEHFYSHFGLHPAQILKSHREKEFITHLSEFIFTAAKSVDPKPVIFRFNDFTTEEWKFLQGGDIEPTELNPQVGYRGAFRYLTRVEEFNLEVEAFRNAKKKGAENLHLMIPFVRTVDEYVLLQHHLRQMGIPQSNTLKYWLMIDTPATAFNLKQYISHGIDGVAVGARDLLTLLTGTSIQLHSQTSFEYQRDPAFFELLNIISSQVHQTKLPLLFCEHVIESRELIEVLVSQNFTGVSVNPHQFARTQALLAS